MFQPNARLNGQSSNWLGTDRGTSLNVGVSTRGRSRCHGSGAAVGRGTCNRAIKKPGDYAHSIRTDNTNRFVFVPHLGTDQVFQFLFDEKSGRLTANTPPVLQLKQGAGPRHLIVSPDNRFVYLLNELTGMVTTLSLDPNTGTLKELDSVSALPADTKLGPGMPRGAVGTPGQAPRNTDNDIWASDLHLTPNGRFLYAAERTSSTLGAFRVDTASGKLTYLGSTPTERQPRGFNIDPTRRFVVVSGEQSDTISSYVIDAETGAPKPIGRYPTGKGANWVEIVAFD